MQAPLSDLLIIDLSRILAGPWATQHLADLGANVIKIEKPFCGDDTRHWGPPNLPGEYSDQLSAYFLSTNRGKQSVAVDIRDPEGQAIVRDLVKKADVVVENYKFEGLKKYALDYESLRQLNSSLIYCSITGFGQTGPNRHKAGYDAMIQAQAGLMSVTGNLDEQPMKAGVAVADLMTGMYASTAILSALWSRQKTGEGSYIDLALYDTQVAWLANQSMNYLLSGNNPTRFGNAHPNIVPYQTFETSDGFLTIAVGNDLQFARFANLLGHPEWAVLPEFQTNSQRVNNRNQLMEKVIPLVKAHSRGHWSELLETANIPFGSVNNLNEVFASPQVEHREIVKQLKHSTYGNVPQVKSPAQINQQSFIHPLAPPLRGEHTYQVLQQLLNIEPEKIQLLKEKEIIEIIGER